MHQSKATNSEDTNSKMKQKSKVNNKHEAEGLKQGLTPYLNVSGLQIADN